MARPKKGTPEGDLATIRWHETMNKKYGSPEEVSARMIEYGRRGGKVESPNKGFGTDIPCGCDVFDYTHCLRQCAGYVGGQTSRRGKPRGIINA